MNIINLSVPAGVSSPVAECGAVMIGYVGEGGSIAAGDMVLCAKTDGTYVVLGKIALS